MAQSGQRKCLNCAEFFTPDARNRSRQHHCNKPACRQASKAAAQAAWLAKPANQDYWRTPCTSRGYRPGALHTQATAASGPAPSPRYKIACPCNLLISLNKPSLVPRYLRNQRYKIS